MATDSAHSLDEVVRREDKLTVLVASDNSTFRKVAPSVFPSEVYEAHLKSKREVVRLVERNGHINPDVIFFNIGGENYQLSQQLDWFKALGLKYPHAELIVTLDDIAYNRLFGSRNRDEALLSIWRDVSAQRNSGTYAKHMQYPSGSDTRAAEEVISEGLTNIRHEYLGPDVENRLRAARIDRTTLKLFVTDLDGSLLNKKGNPSDTDVGAIRRLSEDVKEAYASGRAPVSMETTTRRIQPVSDWYLISHNGALVLKGESNGRASDKVIYDRPMEIHDAIALLQRFGELRDHKEFQGNLLINYFHGNHGNNLVSLTDEKVADLRDRYIDRNGKLKYNTLLPTMGALETHAIGSELPYKVLIIVRRESGAVQRFREEIGDIIESDTLSFSPSQPHYFEFTHRDATKGKALYEIITRLGILPSNVAYVGNSMNDVSAWNLVGHPIAVKNADAEVYGAMDRATSNRLIRIRHERDPVSHAIETLAGRGVYKPREERTTS